MDEKEVRKIVKEYMKEGSDNESDSGSDSDYVCICYGSGDSIRLKRTGTYRDYDLTRKNYNVIYGEHWNNFETLKKSYKI
jgi:hypothetical protein